MIPGIVPAILKKKAVDPGGVYTFVMTAGEDTSLGITLTGYLDEIDLGVGEISIGSINRQPISGLNLVGLFHIAEYKQGGFYFDGDVASILNALEIDSFRLNDKIYPLTAWDRIYTEVQVLTSASYYGSGFLPDAQYEIEFMTGFTPGPPFKFDMTLVDTGNDTIGYSPAGMGSLDPMPVIDSEGSVIFSIEVDYSDNSGRIFIMPQGDATTQDIINIMAGTTVWVDGIEYPFDQDYYDFVGFYVMAMWGPGSAPTLVPNQVYEVEIK